MNLKDFPAGAYVRVSPDSDIYRNYYAYSPYMWVLRSDAILDDKFHHNGTPYAFAELVYPSNTAIKPRVRLNLRSLIPATPEEVLLAGLGLPPYGDLTASTK